ncbi:ADP-ribosylglycohydrolase family protein [Aurantimonas sp. C2-6-R+9]|uniref:ADP-ribosylglycohydrolase family protein n=1 Tax=Aurantimonas sp. C2-6-R+9 TaxID=3114365 RepID=UPI002E17DBA3|nr:ADP-ribosylglycohydrolase family protein [Aurantimonas sp. C2-6-R+9]
MIGAIAGDIVGSRFEGGPAPPAHFALFHPDCRFTDDTVCSLAVAYALMDGRDFAAALRMLVQRHPYRGYGGMFATWAHAEAAPAYGSRGNGAPMRVAAVGWLAADAADASELAAAQAIVSHDHPDAIAASRAVAGTIFALRKGGDIGEVRRWVTEAFGYDLRPKHALRASGFDISAAGTVPPRPCGCVRSR